MNLRAIILCTGLLLAGCASTTPGLNYAARIDAIKLDYSAALDVAVGYESKPRCPPGQGPLTLTCSHPNVVNIVRASAVSTKKVLDDAQKVVNAPGATEDSMKLAVSTANQAVLTFRGLLVQYGVK